MVVLLGWQLPKLEFDYELENFFPIGDPDLEYYNEFIKKFGNDNDYILIGLRGQRGVYNTAFLQNVDRLIGELKDLKGTTNVISLLSIKKVVKSPMGYLEFPYVHIGNQDQLKKLLNPGGVLMISDVRDRFSNPSLYFMEWVGEWPLVYRNDEDFREIFINAGFEVSDIDPTYEQQGILQYIKAFAK